MNTLYPSIIKCLEDIDNSLIKNKRLDKVALEFHRTWLYRNITFEISAFCIENNIREEMEISYNNTTWADGISKTFRQLKTEEMQQQKKNRDYKIPLAKVISRLSKQPNLDPSLAHALREMSLYIKSFRNPYAHGEKSVCMNNLTLAKTKCYYKQIKNIYGHFERYIFNRNRSII
jgi:hypothetical protein